MTLADLIDPPLSAGWVLKIIMLRQETSNDLTADYGLPEYVQSHAKHEVRKSLSESVYAGLSLCPDPKALKAETCMAPNEAYKTMLNCLPCIHVFKIRSSCDMTV